LKRINENFGAKVFVSFLIGLVSIFTSFNYVFIQFQKKNLAEDMIQDGKLLAQVCANNARLGIFAEDKQQIEDSIQSVFQVKEVLQICALNYQKELLTLQQKPETRQQQIESMIVFKNLSSENVFEKLKNSPEPVVIEHDKNIEFWTAVMRASTAYTSDSLYFTEKEFESSADDRVLGFVGVTMDKTPLIRKISTLLTRSIALLLFFLVIGAVVTFFIVRGVTRPLRQLVNEVKSRGIEVASKDELGLLSGTYDTLVEQLAESFKTIDTLKSGLEEKVEELKNEVHERKQAEKALQESEETARSLLNIPINAAALIDADGMILDINENMARTFQRNRLDLIGLCLLDQFPAEEVFDKRKAYLMEVVKTGKRVRFDDEYQGRYWDNYFYPVLDTEGKVLKIAILARDITRRYKAERDRREMEVKALAQSKLASLGEIATGVAHEINQPLSYIKVVYESSLRDIEQKQIDTEELESDFTEALRQVARITHIIDHLRIFGRANDTYFEQVYLPEIMENALILIGEKLKHNNINFTQKIEEPLPLVEGNAISLEQVCINLFQNALTALSAGKGGEIMVNMRREGEFVQVKFSDNGPGIPPEIKDKVFEPFFTTREIGQGTGLGLAIVYGIIKEHKGSVELESEPGHGATFTIALPISPESQKNIGKPRSRG